MYDMYPWDSASAAGQTRKPSQTPPARGEPSAQTPETPPPPLTPQQQAVQFALDRRDNGGEALDAFSAPGQPPASPARQ